MINIVSYNMNYIFGIYVVSTITFESWNLDFICSFDYDWMPINIQDT